MMHRLPSPGTTRSNSTVSTVQISLSEINPNSEVGEHARPGRRWLRLAASIRGMELTRMPEVFSRVWIFREGAENCARGGRAPLAALSALVLLAGCSVGPDYHRPSALGTNAVPAQFGDRSITNAGEWKTAAPAAQIPRGAWWQLYADAELNRLETQAATNNQKIVIAVANFDQARAAVKVAQANFFPQISADPSASRQRTSGNMSSGNSRIYNTYNVSADASWELDVFGRIRRQTESARAELAASAEDLESLKLSIQAEVAIDYFTLRALNEQSAFLNQTAVAYQHALELTQNRRKSGVADELDVAQARANLDLNLSIVKSRKQLFAEGAIPGRDLDTANAALVQAQAAYDAAAKHLESVRSVSRAAALKAAEGQLASAEGKYKGAQAQVNYSEIRSPINGVVTDRPLFAGETAAAGAPLLTVMDTSSLLAKAHIAQSLAQQMKVGDDASVLVAGVADPVAAKVTLISPALDPGSTTVEVWLKIDNKAGTLKAGTPVKVSIAGRTVAQAWKIPASAALTAQDGGKFVMVVGSDGAARRKPVTLGIADGEDVQVTGGLAPADLVITGGAYGLDDGTKVKVGAATDDDKAPAAGKDGGNG